MWNAVDVEENRVNECRFFTKEKPKNDIQGILNSYEPWFEAGTSRLEILNSIKFWRFLTGDDNFDAHYWLTRLENMPENRVMAYCPCRRRNWRNERIVWCSGSRNLDSYHATDSSCQCCSFR